MECATATAARLLPRRPARRWYWAARKVFLLTARGSRRFHQNRAQPAVAATDVLRFGLARTAMVPRTDLGPGRQVAVRGESAHVGADLSEQILRHSTPHPGDGLQPLQGRLKRGEASLDLSAEAVDASFKLLN